MVHVHLQLDFAERFVQNKVQQHSVVTLRCPGQRRVKLNRYCWISADYCRRQRRAKLCAVRNSTGIET